MSSAPTTMKVLDAFLAARASSTPDATLGRCREVVAAMRAYVGERGVEPIDDLTARRLTHDGGREPTELELAAVLNVIEHVPGFFKRLAAGGAGAPRTDCASAADVVRELASWLVQRRLVEDDVAEHLARYTRLYDEDQRTGT